MEKGAVEALAKSPGGQGEWGRRGRVIFCRLEFAMKIVAINASGRRVGEDHQNAKLTNSEVLLLLQMRDEGMSYAELAKVWDIGKSTAFDICSGRYRSQFPAGYVRVKATRAG
jgi:hypothetical protein